MMMAIKGTARRHVASGRPYGVYVSIHRKLPFPMPTAKGRYPIELACGAAGTFLRVLLDRECATNRAVGTVSAGADFGCGFRVYVSTEMGAAYPLLDPGERLRHLDVGVGFTTRGGKSVTTLLIPVRSKVVARSPADGSC